MFRSNSGWALLQITHLEINMNWMTSEVVMVVNDDSHLRDCGSLGGIETILYLQKCNIKVIPLKYCTEHNL